MPDSEDAAVGQGDYIVKEGDCLHSIAERSGHLWETIWNHADNRELKRARRDPMVLLPGDRLTIPEKRPRQESGQTENSHRFVRKGIPATLKLRFVDEDEPRANVPCVVEIDGVRQSLTTDDDGVLELPIPPGARRGSVEVGEGEEVVTYALELGRLDPFDSVRGVQQRLANLGFLQEESDGAWGAPTADAAWAFQEMYDLEPTGKLDDALCERLRELHGS